MDSSDVGVGIIVAETIRPEFRLTCEATHALLDRAFADCAKSEYELSAGGTQVISISADEFDLVSHCPPHNSAIIKANQQVYPCLKLAINGLWGTKTIQRLNPKIQTTSRLLARNNFRAAD